VEFEYATRASKGARSYQEDAAAVRAVAIGSGAVACDHASGAAGLAAALADGMGGHVGGALASDTVCRTFLAAYVASAGNVPARLEDAMNLANEAIARAVAQNPALNGMGCTLVGAAFGAPGIEWVSVGDSPLFLVRNGEIALLNEDHSLAPEIDKLAAAGKISWEAARNDPRRHFLRSAITGNDIDLIDRSHRPLALQAGDVVILASDGIQTLRTDEILRTVNASAPGGPDAIADALIATVEHAGDTHQDNTTVVVVTVGAPIEG
jgi:PPM family protein phosphatase